MMYPSNSSNDLISNYPIRPSSSSSATSKQEEQLPLLPPPPPPFSCFQFPYYPFEDTNEIFQQQQHHHHDDELLLHLHLHHHQQQQQSLPPPNMEQVSINDTSYAKPPPPPLVQEAVSLGATKSKSISNPADKPPKGNQIPPVVMRRRSNKRDRHSKINTARGLRDRRMRLSLDVAKRFFGLQDMLGFDKASKTVDWLLDRSKAEIKQLAREKNHPSYCSSFVGEKSSSSTSDCEGVSSLDEVAQELGEPIAAVLVTTATKRARGGNKPKAPRKKSAFNHIGKESREKARERARERTREKKKMMMMTTTPPRGITNNNNVVVSNNEANRGSSNLGGGSWNPFETVEESGTNQSQNLNPSSSPLDLVAKDQSQQQHLNCVEDHPMGHEEEEEEDSFVVIMNKLWSPTMIFNSLNNSTILQEVRLYQIN